MLRLHSARRAGQRYSRPTQASHRSGSNVAEGVRSSCSRCRAEHHRHPHSHRHHGGSFFCPSSSASLSDPGTGARRNVRFHHQISSCLHPSPTNSPSSHAGNTNLGRRRAAAAPHASGSYRSRTSSSSSASPYPFRPTSSTSSSSSLHPFSSMSTDPQYQQDEEDDDDYDGGDDWVDGDERDEYREGKLRPTALPPSAMIDDEDVLRFADGAFRHMFEEGDGGAFAPSPPPPVAKVRAKRRRGRPRKGDSGSEVPDVLVAAAAAEATASFGHRWDEISVAVPVPHEEGGVSGAAIEDWSSSGGATQLIEDDDSSLESSAVPDTSWEEVLEDIRGDDPSPAVSRQDLSDLLDSFDSSNPPARSDPHALQVWLECESQRETVLRYERLLEQSRKQKNFSAMTAVQRQLLAWYEPLRDAVEAEQEHVWHKKWPTAHGPYMNLLPAEKLAVIAAHEATMYALRMGGSATLAGMSIRVADAVEAEVNVQKLLLKSRGQARRDVADAAAVATAAAAVSDPSISVDADANTDAGANANPGPNPGNQQQHRRMYAASNLDRFIEEANRADPTGKRKQRLHARAANRRAKKLLQSDEEWSTSVKAKLGVALIQLLIDTARMDDPLEVGGKGEKKKTSAAAADDGDDSCGGVPAFRHEKKWLSKKKLVGHVSIHHKFYRMVMEEKYKSLSTTATRFQPMIVPPREWTELKDGGYRALQVHLMRTRGCEPQQDALRLADLDTVFDGLNALGRVPWRINRDILDAAKRCWDEGVVLGDIPSRTDFKVPPVPERPENMSEEAMEDKESEEYRKSVEEFREFRTAMARYRKFVQRNMDLYGLRCSTMLKLNQAEKFQDFPEIYFPYNLDFRGRAYPVPPHLSNIGSDLCRGMLQFSTSKPLGDRGLHWLKVHLANLAGADKMSFDDRAAFTEDNMHRVRASVDDPFGGAGGEDGRWWMTCDDPFQALATCHEIVRAIDSGDPASYESSLPVHQDGSCNGLQHYAALGRDLAGGRAVNLCDCDIPQDVYIGVMEEVVKRVALEASVDLDIDPAREDLSKDEKAALRRNAGAKLVHGIVDRKVVKQTVMTSVYGVTYIGARKQIQERLEEKLAERGHDIDEMDSEIHAASGYLAGVTMDVMGELFTGARQTMSWLASCAKLISARGQPMAWISPIGVPVVQPYRQTKPYTIVTLLQSMVLTNSSDNLPIHKQRQVTAFPPNYVHSLDSSHMLLTSLEMDRRGLTFAAVHDSFWTHAADVDEMNMVLRDCFVDLYEKPLLEELKKNWEFRYPDIEFPDLPERGDLDLEEVKSASYFFQ